MLTKTSFSARLTAYCANRCQKRKGIHKPQQLNLNLLLRLGLARPPIDLTSDHRSKMSYGTIAIPWPNIAASSEENMLYCDVFRHPACIYFLIKSACDHLLCRLRVEHSLSKCSQRYLKSVSLSTKKSSVVCLLWKQRCTLTHSKTRVGRKECTRAAWMF